MDYVLQILTMIGIYMILSTSLNLIAGYIGLLSLAHAAFYGVGAYTAALLALKMNCSFLCGALGAVLIGVVLGVLVGVIALRAQYPDLTVLVAHSLS